jgi:hydroxymethylpyrimidine pyrophosphatase-like HAD family hydrolase
MTLGDYYNDIDMLKMAHYSYAMANAPTGVKEHARFIARSNNEDGVIKAIKEIVLVDESEAV